MINVSPTVVFAKRLAFPENYSIAFVFYHLPNHCFKIITIQHGELFPFCSTASGFSTGGAGVGAGIGAGGILGSSVGTAGNQNYVTQLYMHFIIVVLL